ncbi:MAG: hypothetical protein KDD67_06250 [Ignavibacteriae bacterium]|nr:hypothetical protein [Ignavibacteriota bacterium]MCB9215284.1 hypothetical protein [Ignavibacteria bacterium]
MFVLLLFALNLFPFFFLFVIAVMILMLLSFFRKGRQALTLFPPIDSVNVRFKESRASGASQKNWKTKVGGASNTLDVIVTEDELWITMSPLFASIAQQYDMLHRVPLDRVNVTQRGNNGVGLELTLEDGSSTEIILRLRNQERFLNVIEESKIAGNFLP